ncbi:MULTISPECIES: N-acetyltransferase [Pseudomonas]|uniref:N-acetyltransferase n=1 Tax=Pseudomonas TaxID=286 RepID=UPI000B040A8D|nr:MULTISPECIES: N-acetyltransferase [Pseudomonas]MBP2085724.1 hypothetical protein [Pseudomonas sp. PvP089]MBP2088574.1 hypothetical protein [Pseudomonas sp. PvP088]MBP2225106.1 hypothetical protein [Pseudomonas putida]MCE0882368.1 hypothetical protein [Pseudomonas putida]
MDIKSIKSLIASSPPASALISGVKTNTVGQNVSFQLLHGWDIALAHKCDTEWTAKNIEILRCVQSSVASEEELLKKISDLHMEDAHWRWSAKAIHHIAEDYDWFFYKAEDAIQAACLIYHPKDSIIDGQGIFYIEYIAVAPWNRPNPLSVARFKGIGSDLIRYASKYATDTLGLRPGFSLHSLPKAAAYYNKIGMTCFPERNKESLDYYEMAREAAQVFGAAANG